MTHALEIVPVTFRQACAFIDQHHRHHPPPRGMKVAIGCQNGHLCGVAVISRPVARGEDNGRTAEVVRTCTDSTPNVNSMLYGACRRIAKAMGYNRLITYTEEGEDGASLRAAGWIVDQELEPRDNWYESSQKLMFLRNPDAPRFVRRFRWRAW